MVSDSGFRVSCFGPQSRDVNFCVSCLRHRVQGSLVLGFGFRVSGVAFRVSDFEFRVSGSGFQVSVCGFRFSVVGFRGFGLRILDFGLGSFGFRDSGMGVSGFGIRGSGFGFRGLGFRGSGFRGRTWRAPGPRERAQPACGLFKSQPRIIQKSFLRVKSGCRLFKRQSSSILAQQQLTDQGRFCIRTRRQLRGVRTRDAWVQSNARCPVAGLA